MKVGASHNHRLASPCCCIRNKAKWLHNKVPSYCCWRGFAKQDVAFIRSLCVCVIAHGWATAPVSLAAASITGLWHLKNPVDSRTGDWTMPQILHISVTLQKAALLYQHNSCRDGCVQVSGLWRSFFSGWNKPWRCLQGSSGWFEHGLGHNFITEGP